MAKIMLYQLKKTCAFDKVLRKKLKIDLAVSYLKNEFYKVRAEQQPRFVPPKFL